MHTVENICVSWTSINQLVQKSVRSGDGTVCGVHFQSQTSTNHFVWLLYVFPEGCYLCANSLIPFVQTQENNTYKRAAWRDLCNYGTFNYKNLFIFCWKCLSNSTIIYFLSVEMALITFHLHFPLRLYINPVLKLSSARPVPWPFVGDVHVRTKIGGKFGSPALVSPDSLSVE